MSFFLDSVVMFSTQILFFLGGWVFFIRRLYKDYEVHHIIVQLIFSLTFALSCTMFELIIFEILGILNTNSRYFHWKLDIFAMLFTVIFVLPFYIAYFTLSNIRFVQKNRLIVVLTVAAWLIFVYFFWKLGDPFPILSPKHGKIALAERESLQRAANATPKQRGIWGMIKNVTGSSGKESISQLQQEVNAYEELSRQLFLEVVDLHNTKERIIYSRTLQGKYFNFMGYIFSMYCLWKIVISTINIVFDRVGKTDPVTRGVEIAVNYFGIQFDVKFWSQQISFILVGIIIVTSIRGLLINLTKFFYAISSSKSSSVIVLALAQIMGMYFVSSVLLMRMNMPPEYRGIITEVLGDLQFNFYHRWFDVIFLVSALSSMGFIYLAHQQAPEKNMNP
ncbi:Golgi pH regulator-like [Saccoglossus kowalevskii]|uniref:Golgi pH regulator-like n=1 Tax=Saccoglossus kowalevskii TaxID=10224 RepID=A0ABM0MYF7_SACKO|nr:PREDICTED: Golgi pH regulator-like [Saccoglossus kowalevskii]